MKHRVKNGLKEYFNMVFKDGFSLIKKGGLSLFLFEVIYKMLFIALFYPALILLFEFTLKMAGIKYLTNNYLYAFLKSPFTIISILLLILIFTFYITYEVSCLSVCFDACYHGTKLSVTRIFKSGFKQMRTSIRKKKISAYFNITIISLMMNITILGFFLSNIKINSTAEEIIKTKVIFNRIFIVLFFAAFIYCFIHMFTINYMTYDGDDITDSRRKSRNLLKGRGVKSFFVIAGWNVLILFIIYVMYFILAILIIAGVYILDRVNLGMAIYLSIFKVVLTVVKIIMPIISIPLSYSVITGLFYRYRCDMGSELNIGEITELVEKKKQKHPKIQNFAGSIIAIVLTGINIFYMVYAFKENPFYKVEYLSDTQTMAHRGYSAKYPENTMPAFENAIHATADYIELDVHETKDGIIVVMHDDSLYRTTGVDKKIYNVTYDEIKNLDAGINSGCEEEIGFCNIPTLEEVMEFTKGKVKLNIEIKLSSYEPHLVSEVARLIEKYDYTDDCYVASMNYSALKDTKLINEKIKTLYVLQAAYGDFYEIDYVDAFSINMGYVSKSVVDTIHSKGKKLFVWTINDQKTAEKFATLGVDAIITDDPVMGRKAVYAKYSNSLIYNVLNAVFKD